MPESSSAANLPLLGKRFLGFLQNLWAWLLKWVPGVQTGKLWRLLLALALLLFFEKQGQDLSREKLENSAHWPAGAQGNAELQRGTQVDAYLAIHPDAERRLLFSQEKKEAEANSQSVDREGGVFLDVEFIYNPPLHALVLCILCGVISLLLISVHPLWVLPALVFTAAKVGEFYPVTDYPMYSDPSTGPSWYCYLADGQGEALAVRILCGDTAPKIKKRMSSYLDNLREEEPFKSLYESREEMPPETWEQVAQRVARELVRRSVDIGQEQNLPAQLQIVRVDIFQENLGFREQKRSLGTIETAEVLQSLQAN